MKAVNHGFIKIQTAFYEMFRAKKWELFYYHIVYNLYLEISKPCAGSKTNSENMEA